MSFDRELSDQFEMADGSRPEAPNFDAALAKKNPLGAFTLLSGGDVFEMTGGQPPAEGATRAQRYVQSRIQILPHRASAEHVAHVRREIARLIGGNLQLLARLEAAKPIEIQVIPEGMPLSKFGFPRGVSKTAIGLFWDDTGWDTARMALREEKLFEVPQLTVHEMAHAIHFLAFTADERELIYRTMLRTYRSHASVDEAFAIYSEREFLESFSEHDKRAPGVYGVARQRWNEDHLFTRFVRYLYFPYKPLAGPKSSISQRHLLG